jgi:hypothetical protein
VVVIEGTPSANPVEPQVDVQTQLQLTNVTITAGSSTPTQVTTNTIYNENLPYGGEWVMGLGQGTTGSYTIQADYTGYTAYSGTYSWRTTKTFAGYVSLRWEKDPAQNYNVSDYTNLSLAVRITNAFTTADYVRIYFLDSTNTIISNKINISSLYGFNTSLLNTWQLVTIPISDFKILRTQFAKVVFFWNQTSVATSQIGYDAIKLQGGISNTTNTPVSFGYVKTSSGSASSTIPSDTLTIASSGLTTLSATGKTLTIATPSPIPSQTGNNGKYLTTDGSALSWGTISGMSIGGSITSATAGSVLFAGTSGVLAQDNANFFWDDTNNRLGIGTNTPSADGDITKSVNGAVSFQMKNNTTGTSAQSVMNFIADSNKTAQFQKLSTSFGAPVAPLLAGDLGITNYSSGDIGIINKFATGKIKFSVNNTSVSQMTLTAAGRLLIGTTTESTYILDVNGTARFQNSAYASTKLWVGTTDTTSPGTLTVYSTSAANQLRVVGTTPTTIYTDAFLSGATIAGAVGGCTNANNFVTGTALGDFVVVNQLTNKRLYCVSNTGGVYLTANATAWTANSDITLKNINSYITNAVDKLYTLSAINYSLKEDVSNKQMIGLIAQEVKEVFPEIIEESETGILGLRYTELIPVLVQAIKELKNEINNLKNN